MPLRRDGHIDLKANCAFNELEIDDSSFLNKRVDFTDRKNAIALDFKENRMQSLLFGCADEQDLTIACLSQIRDLLDGK